MSDPEQDKDPVVTSSLSKQLFIWSALLLLSLGWGLYDEVYGIRPWKSYEARFAKVYTHYLRSVRPKETRFENEIKASPDYKKLDSEMQAAERSVIQKVAAIDRQVNQMLVPRSLALNDPFQEVRGHIGALTYQIEIATSESSKDSMRKEIEELKKEVHTVKLPLPDGSVEKKPMTFTEMDQTLQAWKAEKARLLQERVEILKPATDLRVARDKYLSDRIADVSADTLAGLQKKMEDFPIAIRQIHVKDIDLVDRCESCHLGTREPIELTKAAMGGEEVFTSHPNKDLLKIHDPEKFGCAPCHGGNGAAIDSVEKAHGRHKFWLWPMHHPENVEAGCQQCHVKEIVTEMAPTLDAGRELFRLRGCTGCHRYEGYDREPEEMTTVTQQIRQLEQQKAAWEREIGFSTDKADRTRDNAEAQRLYQHANDLKIRNHRPGSQGRTGRHARKRLSPGSEEGGTEPEGSPHEDAQGVDSGLASGPAQVASGDQNAHLPPGPGRHPGHRRFYLAIRRNGRAGIAGRRRSRQRERGVRDARLHGLSLDGRR